MKFRGFTMFFLKIFTVLGQPFLLLSHLCFCLETVLSSVHCTKSHSGKRCQEPWGAHTWLT